MAQITPDEACHDALRELLLGFPDVREGKMFGVPAYYVDKKLFACVYGDVVGVKVPEDLAKHLLEDASYAPFQPYGKPKMREWVQFSCAPSDELATYRDVLLAAYTFVGGGAGS